MDNIRIKFYSMCAVLLTVITCTSCCIDGSDASYTGFGEVYEIDLAPGFRYTYTPIYPSDLDVTTSIHKCESGVNASVNNGTVTISVRDTVTSGSYDVVVMAHTDTAGIEQTSYQHIRINVIEGLSVSGSINNIILDDSISFEPTGTSGMGQVSWSIKPGTSLPDGLTFEDGRIHGEPTSAGKHTISLTANSMGQKKDLVVSFMVYNRIVDNGDESIFSYGNIVSSTPITQTDNDLDVVWHIVDGVLPDGFSLNSATGVVSGKSTTLQSSIVTIRGTTGTGIVPQQTIDKTITILSEPDITLTAGPSGVAYLYTHEGAGDRTLQMDDISGTSDITWSVEGLSGVSVSQTGLITYSDRTPTGAFTVKVTTAYGQVESRTISVVNENRGIINGPDRLSAITGEESNATVYSNIDGTWSIDGTIPQSVSLDIDDGGRITLYSDIACDAFEADIVLTSAGGQVLTLTMTFQVINDLVFNNNPTNGVIAYEV